MTRKDQPQRKVVGVYDRPARADRNWRRWLPWLIALAGTLAWVTYFLLTR